MGKNTVSIEYCGSGWGYGSRVNALADALKAIPGVEVVTRKGRDGSFEVVMDGDIFWSKLRGDGFPDTPKKVEEIVKKVKAKLK